MQPIAVVLPPVAATLDAVSAIVATNLARIRARQEEDPSHMLTGDESRGLHAQTTAVIAAETAKKALSALDYGDVSEEQLESMLRSELEALDRRKALK
jgi:hypothetical protein